jgi:hypothetical protein
MIFWPTVAEAVVVTFTVEFDQVKTPDPLFVSTVDAAPWEAGKLVATLFIFKMLPVLSICN